jgi:hypothetical protein
MFSSLSPISSILVGENSFLINIVDGDAASQSTSAISGRMCVKILKLQMRLRRLSLLISKSTWAQLSC